MTIRRERRSETIVTIARKTPTCSILYFVFTSYAFYVSVARKVLRTEADTGMRCGFTLRVESALGCQTGVYASSVQALLMVGAILIQMTLYIAQIYTIYI